jgi:hypothetical protein
MTSSTKAWWSNVRLIKRTLQMGDCETLDSDYVMELNSSAFKVDWPKRLRQRRECRALIPASATIIFLGLILFPACCYKKGTCQPEANIFLSFKYVDRGAGFLPFLLSSSISKTVVGIIRIFA